VRRAGLIATGAVVLVVGLALLALAFNSRDDAEVGATAGPGVQEPDRGAAHLPAGQRAEVPAGELPASGPHRPDPVVSDRRRLGDVVVLYDAPEPPAALVRLQEEVAGPFEPALAAAGQAVILARREGAGPATALAWRRVLRAGSASDPALRDFAEAWLGRGAKG
jgi:hypothetical protein